jgi:hypothetical protein
MYIYTIYHTYDMKILIDLEEKIIEKVEKKATEEQRSRKQMIELLVERAVE